MRGLIARSARSWRLTHEIESHQLASAIHRLEGLRAKAAAGAQDAVIAAAHEIDSTYADGREAIINAYVAAEHNVLAMPPTRPHQ